MTKRIMLIIGVLAILAASAAGIVTAKPTSSGGMMVFYTSSNSTYLFWCDIEGTEIVDNGDSWDVYSPQGTWNGVDKSLVTYGYFKYKKIQPDYEGSIDGLHLNALTGMELPKSEHIAKLKAVDTALAKPATVTRKYQGQLYDVNCLVTESIKDMYVAGTLQIGDYVLVSFIDEIPETQEISVAVITDKIYESW